MPGICSVLVIGRLQNVLEVFWGAISFMLPYLLCLRLEKVNELLIELHEGCVELMSGTFIGTPSDDLGVLVAIDAEGCC